MIPFRVKKLTDTAKLPEKANEGDLWDIFVDDFCCENLKDINYFDDGIYEYENKCYVNKVYGDNYDDRDCSIEQDFSLQEYNHEQVTEGVGNECKEIGISLHTQGRILIKTGIALELPIRYTLSLPSKVGNYTLNGIVEDWFHEDDKRLIGQGVNSLRRGLNAHAVADLRPRSGLALKHGITVLNAPGTIDNSYRKEIGVILYNAGHEPYTIKKGDKIAQMLIRPLYPSKMEVVEEIEDTTRGGYGSTGK
jgi:dUTP pyrophosphatase